MMRFDYLHDPPPEFVEAIRMLRLPRRLHSIVGAMAMLLCVILLAAVIETLRLNAATTVERRAQARFDGSRIALSGARLAWQQLDALIAEDRRLRAIRLSSSTIAAQLARTGNLIPQHVWLTSMNSGADRVLKGRADGLVALDAVLAQLLHDGAVGQPRLIRMSRENQNQSPLLSFEMRLESGQ